MKKGFLTIPVTLLGILVIVLSLTILIAPVSASLDDGTSWDQFHGDAAHIGVSGSEAPDKPSLIWMKGPWTVNEDGNIKTFEPVLGSSPVVAVVGDETLVYIHCKVTKNGSSGEGRLACLNATTGKMVWSSRTNGSNSVWMTWQSPAYNDSRVFMSGGKVYCFNATNGSVIWEYDADGSTVDENATRDWGAPCDGGPAIGEGVVVAADWGKPSEYHFIRESDGNALGFFCPNDVGVNSYCQGTAAIGDGKAYLTSWEYVGGNVWCVELPDPSAGNQGNLSDDYLWHNFTDENGNKIKDTCGSATYNDSDVFFTTYGFSGTGSKLYVSYATNGSIWRNDTIQRTDCTPAVEGDMVYVCSGTSGYSSRQCQCFNFTNDSVEWSATGYGDFTVSPAVADDKVFVGNPKTAQSTSTETGIFALNKTTGSEEWGYNHGGSSPAVANGVVYTISEGKIYAFGINPKSWGNITDTDFNTAATKHNVTVVNTGNRGAVELTASDTSEELDQSQTQTSEETTYSKIYAETSNQNYWRAQTFKATKSGRLSNVTLRLNKTGSPPNDLTIEIRDCGGSSSQPGDTVLGQKTKSNTSITTSWAYYNITFNDVNLVENKYYSIVLWTPSGGTNNENNCYLVKYKHNESGDSYSNGKMWNSNNGSLTWTNPDSGSNYYDFYFKTYVKNKYNISGYLESAAKDTTYGNTDYGFIFWNEKRPTGTTIKFQIATNNGGSTWNFKGPDGTASTNYTASGSAINSTVHDGDRYIKYKLYLNTSDDGLTPTLDDIFITYRQAKKYDFSTGAGTDKWAYRYQINQTEFNSGSLIYPGTVFMQTQYTNISADDSLNVSDVTTGDGNYSAHRFNITIAENVSDITKINVTWNGKGWHDGENCNGTNLYIYNFSTGAGYELLQASTVTDAEVNLTGEKTSSISSYINSGNVTVLAKQKNYQTSDEGGTYRSHIKTDYVKLYVYTYS